jgi:hypothetical protein
MKKNRLVILITVILVVIALVLVFNQRSSTLRQEASNFAVLDTASITKIFIVDKNNNSVLLERVSPSEWKLDKEFKAHTFQVNALIKTMADLEVRSPVPLAARNNVISRLAASSRKVEIYQHGYGINLFNIIKLFPRERMTKVYYVGGPTADNLGTYMLMEGADEPFIVFIPSFRGFVAAMYSPISDNYRDHTIFNTRFKDLRSVEMKFYEEPEESYVIKRLSDEVIEFIPENSDVPVAYDTIRVLEFLTSFAKVRFESLLNNKAEQAFIDSVTSLTPAHMITVTEVDGKEAEIITFRKAKLPGDPEDWPYDLNRLYGLVNDERDFVLIQYFVFDKLLRPASYFIPKE